MTNYLLLNSRNELGGYIAFSGYGFDHDFPSNTLAIPITETQKSKLDSKKIIIFWPLIHLMMRLCLIIPLHPVILIIIKITPILNY